jgi:hypothetical protein
VDECACPVARGTGESETGGGDVVGLEGKRMELGGVENEMFRRRRFFLSFCLSHTCEAAEMDSVPQQTVAEDPDICDAESHHQVYF